MHYAILYCIVFINFYSASYSLSLSEALPTTTIDTVSEFTCRSATGNCKWRTCPRSLPRSLPKVPTRLLERDSNPRPSGRRTSSLPMSHQAPLHYWLMGMNAPRNSLSRCPGISFLWNHPQPPTFLPTPWPSLTVWHTWDYTLGDAQGRNQKKFGGDDWGLHWILTYFTTALGFYNQIIHWGIKLIELPPKCAHGEAVISEASM